jgi:XTP/dITP diphosphohydrolase
VAKKIYIATTNQNKFKEAEKIFSSYGLKLKHLKFKTVEIQSDSLEKIALNSLNQTLSEYKLPVFVEDAGLFIKALNNFPGPYSSYVFKTIGFKGILRLMKNIKNREAYFLSVIAFGSPNLKPKIFTGKVYGKIALKAKGLSGFGFDPIFQPKNLKKTFAEMSTEEKNKYSHRAKAIKKLVKWLKQEKLVF